jgi:cysteinyl-tRNA synthetase
MNARRLIKSLPLSSKENESLESIRSKVFEALNDDFNTPLAIAQLFDAARVIYAVQEGKEPISETQRNKLDALFDDVLEKILGLREEENVNADKIDGLMQMILKQRQEAKLRKDYAASDNIRKELSTLGFEIKDTKDGATYTFNN